MREILKRWRKERQAPQAAICYITMNTVDSQTRQCKEKLKSSGFRTTSLHAMKSNKVFERILETLTNNEETERKNLSHLVNLAESGGVIVIGSIF